MVHGCVVYTEQAPRRQQFHMANTSHATAKRHCKYTTPADIKSAL